MLGSYLFIHQIYLLQQQCKWGRMEDGSVMPSANCLNVFLCNAEIQQSADKFPTKCILPHLAVEKTVELCKGDHNVEFKYQAGLNI